MLNRSMILVAALVLFAAFPANANIIHAEKGASGQGLATDAFFKPATTVNGVTVTPFDNQGTIFDIFQIPNSFTSGSSFTLSFNNLALGYGVFDCDNGSNGFAISADTKPVNIGSTCTKGPVNSNDVFVSYNEVGNTSTISFLGGTGAPSTFFFWTTDGNLLNIAPVSPVPTPEPDSLVLLASGLAGFALFRRRLAHS